MGVYIGTIKNDYSAMQGPCSSGFHVPSADELTAVFNIGNSLGLWSDSSGDGFCTYLKAPKAGQRGNSLPNTPTGQGQHLYWWSVTMQPGYSHSFALHAYTSYLYKNQNLYRGSALSIRPFKDTPVIPDSSWTSLYSDKIYHNSTLGLISLSADGNTWITIADKNLGATTVWNSGDTLSEANCGKYYQRGNNYGFPFTGNVTTSSTAVNASTYGPGNYYNSSTFIGLAKWDSSDNPNLRGGVTGAKPTELKNAYIGEYVEPPYLCFTANTAGSTIKINTVGTVTAVTLEKSTDGSNWSTYTIGDTITLSSVGSKVYFRNTSETTTGFSSNSGSYQFVMTGSISGGGDVTSLINKNCTATITGNFSFYSLFLNCTSLTTPPYLPATTLARGCYYEMFSGCTALTKAPSMPATSIPDSCCREMFYGCTNLIELPKISATYIGSSAFYHMFRGCSKIKLSTTQTGEYQTAYRIPTTGTGSIGTDALGYMFMNTGGTFTGTPSINTTYYTSNTVV